MFCYSSIWFVSICSHPSLVLCPHWRTKWLLRKCPLFRGSTVLYIIYLVCLHDLAPPPPPPPCSDVTDAELDHRIILEVWDWDRLTANDFVGGLSMRVGEILDATKEKPYTSWYKLLDEKRTKESNERILADDEAIKVRG